MQFSGNVKGEAARKYPGFSYLVPVRAPIDVDGTSDPTDLPQHVDCADYNVRIERVGTSNMHKVQVWMRPNQFTLAKKERLVCEFGALNGFVLRHECCDIALKRAFGTR